MSYVTRSILGLITDPEVRTIASSYLEHWQFEETWEFAYISCIRNPKYSGIVPDLDTFIIDLHTNFHIPESDCEQAAIILLGYNPPKSIDDAVSSIQSYVRDSFITNGIEIIAAGSDKNFKAKGIESIRTAVNLVIAADTFYDFSDLSDISKAKEDDFPVGSTIIKSSFEIINKASSYGGLKLGDLIAIAAGTGIGKSSAMVTEGAFHATNGLKVCHIVLGDLTEYDVFIKYLANYANVETETLITEGYEQYLTEEFISYFKNVRVKSFNPDTLDVYQLLSKIDQLRAKFEFNVLIVDYDANIKDSSNGPNGSSYLEGGVVYANLKGYSKSKCVTYVGSQTKIQYWDDELVLKTYMNDSSKKQHHLDMMIGFGKSKECPYIGKLNIAKMRRGKTDQYTYVHFDNGKGQVKAIKRETYETIKQKHVMMLQGSIEFNVDPATGEILG
jgi:hypothetical protein